MRYWKWTLAILFSLNVAFAADDKKPTKSESTKDEVKDAYDDPEFQKQLQEFSESDREILLPKFLIKTNMGDFIVELDMAHAGKTSENFIKYADEGYYEGTIFHRVIPGFMIQGGGFTPDLEKKRKGLHGPIRNQSDNNLLNKKGTLAMARLRNPHSATSQFFINLGHNKHLDHPGPGSSGWGYTVFGRVVEGMDVVEKISKTPTKADRKYANGQAKVVPETPVIIEKIERYSKSKKDTAKKADNVKEQTRGKAGKPGARGVGKPIAEPDRSEEQEHADEDQQASEDEGEPVDTNAQEDQEAEKLDEQ